MNDKKENKGGWNIWHVLIFCFFAIGTPVFLKYQTYILGPNEKYIYSSYGLLVLSIILSPLLRKLFYKSVVKRYSDEKIIYFLLSSC